MGIRSGACNKLEQAFAAAFARYFVGDPSFTKSDGSPLFVAAQSVSKLTWPQVCFMCFEAVEQVSRSAVYLGTLHMLIDTALVERPDDYQSLLALHDDRVNKCVNLMGNNALLQQLMNAPAVTVPPTTDPRTITNFQLYGIGQIQKEQNKPEANRLCFMQSIDIGFQPNDP